jgi:integrase
VKGKVYKPNCKCEKGKKCTCGATWGYIVDVGINPKTGRRKQKKESGYKTKAEAETALAKVNSEVADNTYINESSILFKDFAPQWLETYKLTHNVKVSTVRIRRHEMNRLLPCFAHYPVKSITKKMYQDALVSLHKEGLADNTLSGIHATGRMIFKKAKEYDLIKIDPTEYAKLPKIKKTVEQLEQENEIPKYLEKDQLKKFLEAARTKGLENDCTIFLTLAYTGMRAGELCALKWKDIDFKAGTLSITKTYYNPSNNIKEYQLLPPKTTKSKRVIEVDKTIIAELEAHKAMQNVINMRLRDVWHDEDFIFTLTVDNPGYPIYVKKIEDRMARLLKLAKLDKELSPHSLRHTHTSLLAEAGVGLPEIMDRLGHQDDNTTKQVYLHVTKTKKKEAAQKFSELMNS